MKKILNYTLVLIVAILLNFNASPAQVSITPMRIINSAHDDFAPILYKKNRKMFFSSDRNNKQEIFEANRDAKGALYLDGLASGRLNHSQHSGSLAISQDGTYMIFSAYEHDTKGEGKTDLYSARKVNGRWEEITSLGPKVNSKYWDTQPTLSADGKVLYFVSNRPGGQGGTDIYVTRRNNEGWEEARPVHDLNSPYDEGSPHLALDGKSFYFSSNDSTRRGHQGGFDIYYTKLNNAFFDEPKNMREINTFYDEVFFVPVQNSKHAYFSSNRAGGQGNLDIYDMYPNPREPEKLIYLDGQILDSITRTPVDAYVVITDLTTGEVKREYDDTQDFSFVLLQLGHKYLIEAYADDYFKYTHTFTVPENSRRDEITHNILLFRDLVMNDIKFESDKATIDPSSFPTLEAIYNQLLRLQSNSTKPYQFHIEGHTDDLGRYDYNLRLSEARAKAVKDWLVSKGIQAFRIVTKGYGESKPLDNVENYANPSEIERVRAMNRRVEIKLVD